MVGSLVMDLSVLRTGARVTGIGRYVASLGRALAAEIAQRPEYQLVGVSALDWSGHMTVARDVGAEVERLMKAPALGHAAWAYRVRLSAARAVRRLSPLLYHQGHPGATPLGDLRCPRLVTAHDLIPLRYPKRYLGWRDGWAPGRLRLDRRRYHAADHIIAISEATAADLVSLLGISSRKISVVPNGVELSRFSPEPALGDAEALARHGLTGRAYLLYVGAGDWRKNYDGMLRALKIARERAPGLGLMLAWAARLDEATRSRAARQAEDAGLGGAVRLLGYVSDADLSALLREARAQLFVSRAEGFGYPVVEAMATGCPVITSDGSSLKEIAEGAALLVDPEQPAAIAEAIVSLANSDAERARLRALGLQRAQEYTVERMAERTFEVYTEVLRAS